MTRTRKQLLKKLASIVKKVKYFIGDVSQWTININLIDQNEMKNEDSSYTTYAYCEPKWEYKNCCIHFNYDQLKESSDKELVGVVVHELYHAAIVQMREWNPNLSGIEVTSKFWIKTIKHEECVVTALTEATCNLLEIAGIV